MSETMRIFIAKPAKKQLKKLPSQIKEKTQKQLQLLQKDISYPSLRFKKQAGTDSYEARIDYHYRFTGKFIKNDFYITFIGPHDEGLGKK